VLARADPLEEAVADAEEETLATGGLLGPALLQPAADALALAVREGGLGRLAVERADGGSVLASPLADALEAAGFRPTPRGLRLRA